MVYINKYLKYKAIALDHSSSGFDILRSMPKEKLNNILTSKNVLICALMLVIVIYLNLSYAHIFSYDKDRRILSTNIQRSYSLDGGSGSENIKYVAIGDSLTYGFGASEYQTTYPYFIAQNLLNKYLEVEVSNLAVPGAVIGELENFQLYKALEAKPGFVSIMIGTNDVHDFADIEDFKNSLEMVVDKFMDINSEVLLINIPYLGTRALILPPHNIIMDQRIRKFNKIIEQVALEKNVGYFDLYNATSKPFSDYPDKYYSIDKFHPSNEGYVLWGNLINGN